MSQSQDKVVSIIPNQAPDTPSAARMPMKLRKLQDKVRQGLIGLLQTMFDNADDALFELADKARSNIEQNIFFESMREVRLKRRNIETEFAQLIPAKFEQAYTGEQVDETDAVVTQVNDGRLSLVQNDELEEQVAIDGMVAKGLVNNASALRLLTQRVDSLIPGKPVDGQSNPLGPRAVCDSFMRACRVLDVEIKSKLVVYKLFDKFVMRGLDELYDACNTLLIEEGVLPNLQDEAQPQRPRGTQPVRGSGSHTPAGASNAANHEMFSTLQGLLAQQQHAVLNNEILQSAKWFAPGTAPELPTPQVMDLLGDVQHRQEQQLPQAFGPEAELQPVDVHTVLRALLEERDVKERKSLGRVDFDAINLVALLFQFILDDPNLATLMKALIGRLQIPILKVAMLDKSFFNKGGHPARKLLNKIATSALGWTPSADGEADPLLETIEATVHRVLTEFDDDVTLFDDVLSDYEAFIGAERKRATLIEKRTVDAEDGRARADSARQQVQTVLNDKVAGLALPPVVLSLLQEAWSNVLFLACLKEGVDGESWSNALATVDDLLWSVAEHSDTKDNGKLLKMLPDLLKRLRSGLTQISYDSFKMNELFSELEQMHLAKLRGTEDRSPEPQSKGEIANGQQYIDSISVDTRTPVQHNEDDLEQDAVNELLNSIDAVISDEGEAAEEKTENQTTEAAAPVVASSDRAATDAAKVAERIVLSPTPGQHVDLTLEAHEQLAEDSEFYIKASQLEVGSWVEMKQAKEKKFRAKLAAITKPNLKYIFVNRAGMKVSERSLMGLAVELQRRSIVLLDDSALFDRALQAVIGNLRSFKKAPTT